VLDYSTRAVNGPTETLKRWAYVRSVGFAGVGERRVTEGEAVDENAELEAAMHAMADAPSEDAWRALFGVLARSTLIVPVGVVDGEPTDEVLMQEHEDGSRSLPAFTNGEAFARWAETPGPYVRLDAPMLARMALGGGANVALNPADAFGGQFVTPDLQALAGDPVTEPAGTSFRVANTPPSVPEDTVASLRDCVRGVEGVRALWLFTGAYGDDEPGLFLGVESDPDVSRDRDETMQALAGALGSALPSGVDARMQPLDAGMLEFVRDSAIEVSAN
jgi:hypothetical protein